LRKASVKNQMIHGAAAASSPGDSDLETRQDESGENELTQFEEKQEEVHLHLLCFRNLHHYLLYLKYRAYMRKRRRFIFTSSASETFIITSSFTKYRAYMRKRRRRKMS
ncbi:unnamed protein product, partial [Pleuronectes platessa]